jgi:hypothetical protein
MKVNIIPSKPGGQYIYHSLQNTKTLHSAHTVYLCVRYHSHLAVYDDVWGVDALFDHS